MINVQRPSWKIEGEKKHYNQAWDIASLLWWKRLEQSSLPESLQQLTQIITPMILSLKTRFPREKREQAYLAKHLGNPSFENLEKKWTMHYAGACLEYCRLFMAALKQFPAISNISCDTFLCWETTRSRVGIPLILPVVHTTVSFSYQGTVYSLDNMQATSFHLYPWKKHFKKFSSSWVASVDQSVSALAQTTHLKTTEWPDDMSYLVAMAKKYPRLQLVTTFFRDRQAQRYMHKREKDQVIDTPYILRVFPRWNEEGYYEEIIG